MSRIVHDFYDRVIADNEVNHFFKNSDMDRQKQHMSHFLGAAFGSGEDYDARLLTGAHAKLQAGHGHFDKVVEHLKDTLQEHRIPQQALNQAVDQISGYRQHIVQH